MTDTANATPVTFYGHCDDLIEIEGLGNDEIDCYECSDTHHFDVVVEDSQTQRVSAGSRVRVIYSPSFGTSGCWAIVVSPIDEDVPLLEGTLDTSDNAYSPALHVWLPVIQPGKRAVLYHYHKGARVTETELRTAD